MLTPTPRRKHLSGAQSPKQPTSWLDYLFAPIDIASLVVFRVALGVILLVEMLRFLLHGWVYEFYVAPVFHFSYFGFAWLRPLPPLAMYGLFLTLCLLAGMIVVGWHYRTACLLFCAGFTYVFLLEKAFYMNHFYFVCLLTLVMAFVPAQRQFSYDARRGPGLRSDYIPRWSLWLLRFMIALPYVYGGIAKINADWLQGQPMQMWMSRMTQLREFVPMFGEPWLALAFSYGGLALDLLIVPLLLWTPTRRYALVVAIFFHVCNSVMFQIGIFPWLMICGTTLFLAPDWPRRVLRSVPQAAPMPANFPRVWPWADRFGAAFLGLFLLVQIIVPWRHLLYPGDVDWTEEGSRFAWRMMLNEKIAALQFVAVDPKTQRVGSLDIRPYLTPRQLDKMSYDPEMIREFAHFLQQQRVREGHGQQEIHALVFCALNGRKPQLLVDPRANLATRERTWQTANWIKPLTEPLPEIAWTMPPAEWPQHFDLAPQAKFTPSR
ncbi:MAG TPA: HTTM domain-containing protein [Pirellulaceae bacterium]|nr:HTTM domain-containing protein [Pirellulaceae bacterium]